MGEFARQVTETSFSICSHERKILQAEAYKGEFVRCLSEKDVQDLLDLSKEKFGIIL